jgi:hypothetical protein
VVVLGLAGACADIVLFLLPDLLRGIPLEIQGVVRQPLLWIALAIPTACLSAERFAGVAPSRWASAAPTTRPG